MGTDGAAGPFWSPDSRTLGFFAHGQLKTVSLLGELPKVLCPFENAGPSGTWGGDGVILFSQNDGIYQIAANGGAATRVTSLSRDQGELAHVLPQFLPDGRHFLYTVRAQTGSTVTSWIVAGEVRSAETKLLVRAQSQALYTGSDYLLFLRDGILLAQPFDAARLRLKGDPSRIRGAESIGFNPATPRGMFSASQNGVLAYSTTSRRELVWFDRSGKPIGSIAQSAFDTSPALSRDGQRLAVSRYDPTTSTRSLWIRDLQRDGVASPLTAHPSWETCAVWSPDDADIVFARGRPDNGDLYLKRRTTEERPIGQMRGCPLDWSRDGRYLLFGAQGTGFPGSGLWFVSLTGNGAPTPLAGTERSATRPSASISPDGRWIAYASDVSGRSEVYVRAFPAGTSGDRQVSLHGGIEPQWRADGRELFFIGADRKLMAVSVSTSGPFQAGTPTALFATQLEPSGRFGIVGRTQYLVSADGQKFLLDQPRSGGIPLTVLINWLASLIPNP